MAKLPLLSPHSQSLALRMALAEGFTVNSIMATERPRAKRPRGRVGRDWVSQASREECRAEDFLG